MSAGFYKLDESGELLCGLFGVYNANYTLLPVPDPAYPMAQIGAAVTTPVDGWCWYESEETARIVLGLPPKIAIDVA